MSWDFGNKENVDDLELFVNIVGEYVTDKELLGKIRAVYKEHWPRLIAMQASSSGKYHHWIEQTVPYGLLNHHIRGLWFCRQLCIEEAGLSYRGKEEKLNRIVQRRLTAMAVHDLGKLKALHPGHGVYVHSILKPHGFDKKIHHMAQNHMHRWTKKYVAETTGQLLVAYADYLASKPEIHVTGIKYIVEMNGKPTVLVGPVPEPVKGIKVNMK